MIGSKNEIITTLMIENITVFCSKPYRTLELAGNLEIINFNT